MHSSRAGPAHSIDAGVINTGNRDERHRGLSGEPRDGGPAHRRVAVLGEGGSEYDQQPTTLAATVSEFIKQMIIAECLRCALALPGVLHQVLHCMWFFFQTGC